jgi:hypothetical protein
MSLQNPKKAQPGKDFDPEKSNLQKSPDQWVTGDQPMTDAQASYLQTLCEEAKEKFNPKLSKAQASKEIDRLQEKTGRAPSGGQRQTAQRQQAQRQQPQVNDPDDLSDDEPF